MKNHELLKYLRYEVSFVSFVDDYDYLRHYVYDCDYVHDVLYIKDLDNHENLMKFVQSLLLYLKLEMVQYF